MCDFIHLRDVSTRLRPLALRERQWVPHGESVFCWLPQNFKGVQFFLH
jgi:hypothetical protein